MKKSKLNSFVFDLVLFRKCRKICFFLAEVQIHAFFVVQTRSSERAPPSSTVLLINISIFFLGESLQVIGERLTEHNGVIAVSGTFFYNFTLRQNSYFIEMYRYSEICMMWVLLSVACPPTKFPIDTC
jgi:hypothetical protein